MNKAILLLTLVSCLTFSSCASKQNQECSTCPIKRALTGAPKPPAENRAN